MKKIALLVLFLCIIALSPAAFAATTLPDGIYLEQQGEESCTSASAAMMLRARTYLCGNNTWGQITEGKVESIAWINGQGLSTSFTYDFDDNHYISVDRTEVDGFSLASLKTVLDAHPEGIVLYCRNIPHAVFVCDYEGDTFYCADPGARFWASIPSGRIPLGNSSLSKSYWNQDGILNNTTHYWYVSSYSVAPSAFTLDINGLLDGSNSENVSGYGTFDIYINGSLAGNDVSDYYNKALPAGTEYGIGDIKPLNGKSYVGLSEGTRTGTLDRNIGVRLAFHTIPNDPGVAPVVTAYNGHSYYFFDRQSTWYAAKQLSESYGGHLVTITSAAENSFVSGLAGGQSVWIGATDQGSEGSFKWVNGETFRYSNWASGEPNNYPSAGEDTENYVHLLTDLKWNDSPGCVTYPFVCEIDRVNTILYHYYGTLVPKRQVKAIGQSITLLDFIPTREGYTFLGWSTVSSTSEPEYQPGDTYSADADLDLHAVWFANEYTITYDANGGMGAPEAVTIEGGATTLSNVIPTRAHHRFLGWAARADATQARYQPGGTYNGGTVTLYAVWERVYDNLFVLPHVLTSIEDEAFLDTDADAVFIPATVTEIGSNAFGDVAVYGYAGSYAETWAKANGKPFIPITDGWVPAEQVPQGARITDEKWTYQKSTTETTTSTEPSLTGWTQGNFTWQQSGSGVYEYVNFPGGFDTGHTLYNSYGKAPLTNTTSGNTKREPGASAHKSYIYWHWTFTDYVEDSNRNVSIEDAQKYGVQTGSVYRDYVFFDAFETPLSLSTEGMTTGGLRSFDGLWSTYHHPEYNLPEYASWWWYRAEVMQQPYTDYQKIFTYTRTVTTDETSSTPVTEGSGISNVIHWVKYEM